MATRRWSIGVSENAVHVVEAVGAATATKAIEVTVDLAQVRHKPDAMKALAQISAFMKSHNWPIG